MATNRKRTIADFSKDEDFAETKHHQGSDDWEATRMAAPTVGVAARLFKTGNERSVTVQLGATSASLEMQTLDGKVAQFAWANVKYDAPMAGAPGIFELPNGLTIEVADHTAFKQLTRHSGKGASRLMIVGMLWRRWPLRQPQQPCYCASAFYLCQAVRGLARGTINAWLISTT